MEKILVSSCLVGLPIRYNGSDKATDVSIISKWKNEGRLVHICPEVSAGFPTPRPPAEISGGFGIDVLSGNADVFENSKQKVTDLYISGAHMALRLAQKNGIRVALLTDGSPSCGSTFIYDGGFTGRTLAGNGVTAALLEQNGIKVFPDTQISDADAYLHGLEKQPNQAPEPTVFAVTSRAQSSTSRASEDRGSS
ncbi:MAG: DUF523 domain-containing protein [Chitinophagaceae bacterium]|nr:DUF523 domain-containing protein [Chitinophagaceae bacterium]